MTTINIPMYTSLQCECGMDIEVRIPACRTIGVGTRCECGLWVRNVQPLARLCEVFALFGVRLALDYDGELIAESDAAIPEVVKTWLFQHQSQLRGELERDGKAIRSVFVGGTRGGERHRKSMMWSETIVVHIGRGHWEVYVWHGLDDPRLWYIGRATSESKARKREFVDAKRRDRE